MTLYNGCRLPRESSTSVPDCQIIKKAIASMKPLEIDPSRNKSSLLLITHLHKIIYLKPYIKKQNKLTSVHSILFEY